MVNPSQAELFRMSTPSPGDCDDLPVPSFRKRTSVRWQRLKMTDPYLHPTHKMVDLECEWKPGQWTQRRLILKTLLLKATVGRHVGP